MLATLPAAVRTLVERFIAEAGVDFTDAAAVRGECDIWSRRLAVALHGVEVPSYYDAEDMVALEAGPAQVWLDEVPAALAGDEMAPGHWVCRVTHDGYDYDIDLTAAQFSPMGWTGPRAYEA